MRQASEVSGALVAGRDGNLYGITKNGGLYGGGTVFRIAPNGRRTVLKQFRKGADNAPYIGGVNPEGPLAVGNDGAIYGATKDGGIYGYGVLFRIDEAGTYEVIHDFSDPASFSKKSLLVTREGELYGVDNGGEYSQGSIFRFSLSGDFSTVFSFHAESLMGTEGEVLAPYYPNSITQASNGKIYGTTLFGGPLHPGYVTASTFTTNSVGLQMFSGGAVFRLDGDDEITVLADNFNNFTWPANLVERAGSNFYGLYRDGIFSVGETGGNSHAFYLSSPNSLIRAGDSSFYTLSSTGDVFIAAPQSSGESDLSVSSIPTPPTGSKLCRINLDGTLQDVFQRPGSEVMQGLVQGADGTFYGTLQAPNLRVFKIQVPGLSAPNTAPVARTDYILIGDVRPLTNSSLVSYEAKIDVLGNDSDFNGDALSITAVTQPTWGTATIDAATGKVIYTTQLPKADSFTYTISDSKGGTATGRVSIRPFVNPVYTPHVVLPEVVVAVASIDVPVQAPFVPLSEITLTPRDRVAGQAISKDPATGKIITYRFSGKLDSFGRFSTRVEKNGSSLQIVLKAIPENHGWKIWAKVTGAAEFEGYCYPKDFASIQ